MLERVMFQKENKTHGGYHTLLDFAFVENQMREFKVERVYPEIDAKEREESKKHEAAQQLHSSMAVCESSGKFLDHYSLGMLSIIPR
jgi:hypothetical protein